MGLQRASEESPLVLFVDDLQWADPTTLSLLHYLARNISTDRILILGTYRPEDIKLEVDGKPHYLVTAMQNMSREHLFENLELKRFDLTVTGNLVESALGPNSFEVAFFERVYKETEGTPFFVLEVLKLLIEDGVIVKNEVWDLKADIGTIDIPSKVYDVIKRRLDRLIAEQREILECASVIGEEFTTDILEKATDMRRMTLLKNLGLIEKSHQLILYLRDKYRFNHAKIKEVLYNGIAEELRREYHLIVADTLEEVYADRLNEVVSDLAYHYSEARNNKAKAYLIKAGDRAKDRFANEEAVRFYTTAIPMIEEGEELISTHVNLGNIHSILGDLESAMKNYDLAYGLEKDDLKRVGLHILKSQVCEKKGDYRGLKEECDNGLALIGDKETEEKAALLVIMGGLHART
ncbi:MAG: hypothetical protein KAI64_00995, partial [Thermoplasmata archaeon]|nr:hypothetical protein [Thermoplasmata archaeon]